MTRLYAMIVKEFWAALRDPRARIVLFVPPMVQLFIFSLATPLEVRHFDIGVLDRSGGPVATEFLSQVAASPDVRRVVSLRSPEALRDAIDNRQVLAAIVLEPDFDRTVAAGGTGTVGLVLDGRRSNAAQIVAGYFQRIAAGTGATLRPVTASPPGESIVTNWFNPNLDYIWFVAPSMIVTIGAISGLSITAQSVARERELGTFEQLMVTPLSVHEILIGKMVPPVAIGLVNGTLYLPIAVFVFGVPFSGSLPLYYLSLFVFLLALVGIGMLVSAASQSQQQAFLGVFLVAVPVMILSGYASPVDNMPGWLQLLSAADPARWFLEIVDGLFLKAMPAADVARRLLPLALIAAVALVLSGWLFRARME